MNASIVCPLIENSLGHVLYSESGDRVVFDVTNNAHDDDIAEM
jgi:hypothetical protein